MSIFIVFFDFQWQAYFLPDFISSLPLNFVKKFMGPHISGLEVGGGTLVAGPIKNAGSLSRRASTRVAMIVAKSPSCFRTTRRRTWRSGSGRKRRAEPPPSSTGSSQNAQPPMRPLENQTNFQRGQKTDIKSILGL